MLALNHALFGAIIAVSVKQPALIIPLGIASHFVLDALPHFGNSESFGRYSNNYYLVVFADGIAMIIALAAMTLFWPHMAGIILLGSISAMSPDLLWPLAPKVKSGTILSKFFIFHKKIQLSETPKGIISELAWSSLFATALINIARSSSLFAK